MGFNLNKWYDDRKSGDVLLEISGGITVELIQESLSAIEKKLEFKGEPNPIRKKIFNVFVECLQNLYHHVDRLPELDLFSDKDNFGAIILVKEGTFYRISTGNFVKNEQTHLIKDRIDQVNALSENEVRMLYRDILNNDEFSDKGGGGLGMLDIVRKTGNKLEYYFYPYNDQLVFFALDVYIS